MNYTRLENYLQFAHDALDKMESALDSGYQLREEDHVKVLNEAIRSIKNVAEELGVRLDNLAFVPDVAPLDKVDHDVLKWAKEDSDGEDYLVIYADRQERSVGFSIDDNLHKWTPELAMAIGYTITKAAYEARRDQGGGDL